MKLLLTACLLILAVSCSIDESRDDAGRMEPPRIPLWNGRAPVGDGTFEQAEAWITVHRPPEHRSAGGKGPAIVICPGGGYSWLAIDPEGHGIARWLNLHGVSGIVLEYRLPAGRPTVPLLDAQRALRTVRANPAEWGIDPSRLGIMGFSAGGHLASTTGTHFDDGDLSAADSVDRASCRPIFCSSSIPSSPWARTLTKVLRKTCSARNHNRS